MEIDRLCLKKWNFLAAAVYKFYRSHENKGIVAVVYEVGSCVDKFTLSATLLS